MGITEEFVVKFIKFGVVGLSGVVVDFATTYLLKEQLKVNKYVANSAGFLCAVVSNYVLNRMWTFHDHNPDVTTQFGKFFLIALFGLALNNAIIYFLTEKLNLKFYTAKLVATGIVTIWNFFGNLLFTFK